MKRLKYLTIIFLIALVVLTNTSCKKENRMLDKPTNVILDNKEILSWEPVKNATSYIINVDDNEYITENTNYDLFEILNEYKVYKITLVAKNDSSKYLISDSYELKYEVKLQCDIEYKLNGEYYEVIKQNPDYVKGKVIIPKTYKGKEVRKVANEAFRGFKEITGVILQVTITELGGGAFYGCEKLTRVILPSSITELKNATFSNCTSLVDIKIPEGIQYLEGAIFHGCTNLESIYLPSTFEFNRRVRLIAFERCPNLKTIIVDENNPEYYSDMNCLIKRGETTVILGGNEFTIPDYIDKIEAYAYAGRDIKTINLKNIKSIGSSAFSGCKSLTDIYLEDVETVDAYAFSNCTNLTNIQLKDVETIGEKAFMYCTSLIGVNLKKANSIGKEAFSNCTSLTDIRLEEVESIGKEAFSNCTSLTNIQLKEVNSIGKEAFLNCTSLTDIHLEEVESVGDYAFSKCENLNNVYFSEKLKSIGINPFLQSFNTNIIIDSTKYCVEGNCLIDKEELAVISGFSNSTIPDYIKEIKDYAFSYCSFETIALPKGLEIIGECAFCWNNKFEYITIPSSVKIIKSQAFTRPTPNMMSVIFDGFTGILEDDVFGIDTVYTNIRKADSPWKYPPSRQLLLDSNMDTFFVDSLYNCGFKEEDGEKYVYAITFEPTNPAVSNNLCNPDSYYKSCHRKGYKLVGLSKEKDSNNIDVKVQEINSPIIVNGKIIYILHFYAFVGKDINALFPEGGVHTMYTVWEKE